MQGWGLFAKIGKYRQLKVVKIDFVNCWTPILPKLEFEHTCVKYL